MKNFFYLSIILLYFFSCKGQEKTNQSITSNATKSGDIIIKMPKAYKEVSDIKIHKLPNGKTYVPDLSMMIDQEKLAELFCVKNEGFRFKCDQCEIHDMDSKAYFFAFPHTYITNWGGVVIVRRNQFESEIPDFIEKSIENLKVSGQSSGNGNSENLIFDNFTDIGDSGAFHHGEQEYNFQYGNALSFLIKFNAPMEADVEKQLAVNIGRMIMAEYKKLDVE